MLIDLVSQSNYQSYNVRLAHLLGLDTAVYLNALIEIAEKAMRKGKVIDGDFFIVDTGYIEQRTTLIKANQDKLKLLLEDSGIIIKHDTDKKAIKIDLGVVTSLVTTADEKVFSDLNKIARSANKKKGNPNILANVKKHIDQTLPEELIAAFEEWLDMVNQKDNYVNNRLIEQAQREIEEGVTHNGTYKVQDAVDALHLATARGWKTLTYAVEQMYKQRASRVEMTKVVENKDVQVNTQVLF